MITIQTFEEALLAWHDRHARDLPWCGESDPYRIWISEIMLQQTRTETVAGYYHAFLKAFPDVFALAEASQEQVFKRWEGLGYYSRARNLHKAAKIVAHEMDGQFPDTAEGLRKLPGIGDYTAGAIASIAFHRRELAMDGNVTRALSRLTAQTGCVGVAGVRRALKAEGTALMTDRRPGDFNQAMMGLGNMVCVPGRPKCAECPVREFCKAKRQGIQETLPVLPAKPEKKEIPVGVALVFLEGRVLLVRRPDEGLLAQMWAFPAFEEARTEQEVREALSEIGVDAGRGSRLVPAKHVFTHRVWNMKGYAYQAKSVRENETCRLVSREEMNQAALPTALKAYREIAGNMLEEL